MKPIKPVKKIVKHVTRHLAKVARVVIAPVALPGLPPRPFVPPVDEPSAVPDAHDTQWTRVIVTVALVIVVISALVMLF